jgi:hypothetical protein
MGGFPSSMKDIPGDIEPNQTVVIKTDKGVVYVVHRRDLTSRAMNSLKSSALGLFLPKAISDIQRSTDTGRYFMTDQNGINITTTTGNSYPLKVFIKMFSVEQNFMNKAGIDLEKCTFEIQTIAPPPKSSSFGSTRSIEKLITVVDKEIVYLSSKK